MEKTVQEFRLYLLTESVGKKRRRSPRTVKLHCYLLQRLIKVDPTLSAEKIQLHLLSLFENGRKGTYLNDYIDTLHIYGRFRQSDKYKVLKYFPEDHYEKATLSDEEIEMFLALPCPSLTRTDTRSGKILTYTIGQKRWIVKTMFWKIVAFSGMRLGEVAHLTINDVDFGRGIFLADGKTGHRIVPISPAILSDVKHYVSSCETGYLFPSKSGRQSARQKAPVLDDTDWNYDFHQRLQRLNIKRKNLTPYSLRHSFITRLLSEDVAIPKVQKIVGHKRIDTTMHYTHLTTKDITKAISQDPLGLKHIGYNERFKHFRDNVRLLLQQCCTDHLEESKFIKDLVEGY